MHLNPFIRPGMVCFWIISMGALLRFDAYPHWFTRTLPGYRGIITDTLLAQERWARILIGGVPAGYSQTTMGVNDEAPGQPMEINTRIYLRMHLFGEAQRIFAQTLVELDRDMALTAFKASVSAGPLGIRAEGRRREGDRFDVHLETDAGRMTRSVRIPPEALMHLPLQELTFRRLRPGGRISVHTFDPLTLQPAVITIEAVGYETLVHDQHPIEALRLRYTWQGIAIDGWIGKDGRFLRQETPVGWVIEACTAEQALAAAAADDHPPPVLIPSGGSLFSTLFNGRKPGHDRD